MEQFIVGMIMFYIGKYSDKIDKFILKHLPKKKKVEYNGFYDCLITESDFEKEKRGE